MGKIEETLRGEIGRLARKEVKAAIAPLAEQARKLKRANAEIKKSLAALEKAVRKQPHSSALGQPAPQVAAEEATKARLSPGLIKKLRKRLGISQGGLAALVDVSQPAVASWEQGRANPRPETRAAVVALRARTAEEVQELLGRKAGK